MFLEQGKPLIFGASQQKGIKIDGMKPVVVDLTDGSTSAHDLWIHDERDFYKAQALIRMFDDPGQQGIHFPRPFGVFMKQTGPVMKM